MLHDDAGCLYFYRSISVVHEGINVELFKPDSCGEEYHYYAFDQQFGYHGPFVNLSVAK